LGKPVRLYPYAVSDQLSIVLSDFDDPENQRSIEVREIQRDVSSEGNGDNPTGYDVSASQEWSKLAFRITATITQDELRRLAPDSRDTLRDLDAVVTLTCQPTKFRNALRLQRASDGHWRGVATVQRQDLKGILLVKAHLIRATRLSRAGATNYATEEGAIVAIAPVVALHLDIGPKSGSDSIPIVWEDFANSLDPWRRGHAADVFYLDPYGLEPVLHLNSRYSELRDLLDSKSRKGPEAALRDMTACMIGQTAWSQLIHASLAAISWDESSNAGSAPMEGWRGVVLKTCLPRMYPDEPDLEHALNRAGLDLSDPDGKAAIAAKVGSVAQAMVSSFKAVELTVRAFESSRDREEVGG
jgi:hypothetical protein